MQIITATRLQEIPNWAKLQRELFDLMNTAAIEFADRYTRSDGTLIWRDSWPGMDGSDDPYEGFMNYPLLYALGGSEEVYKRSRLIWEGITWQWTQYGQIYNEFDAYYDWMHHGESNLFFYFLGLADPNSLIDRYRSVKFAALYNGDNPEVQNYDAKQKIVRSPITGSRGPRFNQTAEDWSTHREVLDNYLPPFEDIPNVNGNAMYCPWSDDTVYEAILQRINERQARGDVPLNLNITSLMLHAFMYTQDEKYANWSIDYLEAWKDRTRINGGITPDNIGLSGVIGEYNDGKWWGGYYGWRWPHGSCSILEPEIVAGCNNVLLTGDFSHLDLARSQLDLLWSMRKLNDKGQWVVPNRHYDDGWRDFRLPHPMFGVYLWNLSMDEQDAERAERGWVEEEFAKVDARLKSYGLLTNGGHMGFNGNTAQWFSFIRGNRPDYPESILATNKEIINAQIAAYRSEEFNPITMDHYKESMSIHMWQERMPVIIEGLAQLTLGGPMHIYHGGLQHARFRYFDGIKRRPGLPEDIAALVERLHDTSAVVSFVNLSSSMEHVVIVQAGVYGEHRFTGAEELSDEGDTIGVFKAEGKWCAIKLPPSTTMRIRYFMERYVNKPTYENPWSTCPHPIIGRNEETK